MLPLKTPEFDENHILLTPEPKPKPVRPPNQPKIPHRTVKKTTNKKLIANRKFAQDPIPKSTKQNPQSNHHSETADTKPTVSQHHPKHPPKTDSRRTPPHSPQNLDPASHLNAPLILSPRASSPKNSPNLGCPTPQIATSASPLNDPPPTPQKLSPAPTPLHTPRTTIDLEAMKNFNGYYSRENPYTTDTTGPPIYLPSLPVAKRGQLGLSKRSLFQQPPKQAEEPARRTSGITASDMAAKVEVPDQNTTDRLRALGIAETSESVPPVTADIEMKTSQDKWSSYLSVGKSPWNPQCQEGQKKLYDDVMSQGSPYVSLDGSTVHVRRYALRNDQKDKGKKAAPKPSDQGTQWTQGHSRDAGPTHRHPTIPPKRKSTSSPVQKKRPWWMNEKVKEEHGKGIR